MRSFGEADRKKKKARIQIRENPEELSSELLSRLEDMVRASTKDGHITCALCFNIAKKVGVPRLAVGETADRLGVRITDCQIGCFKIDKTIHDNSDPKDCDDGIISKLVALKANDDLTCLNVFGLAEQSKSTPRAIAGIANNRNFRIRGCQLGCF